MKIPQTIIALPLLAALFSPTAWAGSRLDDLMERMDLLYRSKSSHVRMTMEVKTKNYQRSLAMEGWSEGKEKSLIVIRSPKKDAGVATLKVERNIWNYLPKVDRQTKVPPSMMMGSWMGSHFTNDDLVRESSYKDDFSSKITFEGQREGLAVIEVTMIPDPDAPVVWGKVVMVIEAERLLPVRMDYYDEEGALSRTMVFDRVKRLGGRELPTRMRITPHDKPGEFTEVVYQEMAFDLPLGADVFSLQGLRRKR